MHKALVAGTIVVGALGVGSAVGAVPPGLEKKGAEEGDWECDGIPTQIFGGNGRSAWVGDQKVLALSIHFEGTFTPADGSPPETEGLRQVVAQLRTAPGTGHHLHHRGGRDLSRRNLRRIRSGYRRTGSLTSPSRPPAAKAGLGWSVVGMSRSLYVVSEVILGIRPVHNHSSVWGVLTGSDRPAVLTENKKIVAIGENTTAPAACPGSVGVAW